MTIIFTPGITQSVWLSFKEEAPIGWTGSWTFLLTNDITGATKSATLTDLQPLNKWTKFNIKVGTPEVLNSGTWNLQSGMWSWTGYAGSTKLQSGKIMVQDAATWSTIARPSKNTGALRR
jgi:hypothetical protein